jgi:hypothetical protein
MRESGSYQNSILFVKEECQGSSETKVSEDIDTKVHVKHQESVGFRGGEVTKNLKVKDVN